MVERIEAAEFILRAKEMPVADVRSPKEYLQGHIHGSFNLPLFNDEERAIIGTLYKNSGREAAVLKGLELAGPKLSDFIKALTKIVPGKNVLVHCWRGGMRSEQMAWLFDQAGFGTSLLNGGYKAYRKFIREQFSKEARIIVLGGLTGSGKTEILHTLGSLGEQILDLEKIACHRGSVFGGLGQVIQPTNEQFENELAKEWDRFDFSRTVWIEDESRSIGNVIIPEPLFDRMSKSMMISIERSREKRSRRLVKEYSGYKREDHETAVMKISEKLGGTRTRDALKVLEEGDYFLFTEIVLDYYDKTYRFAVEKRIGRDIHKIIPEDDDPEKNAARVKEIAKLLKIVS